MSFRAIPPYVSEGSICPSDGGEGWGSELLVKYTGEQGTSQHNGVAFAHILVQPIYGVWFSKSASHLGT